MNGTTNPPTHLSPPVPACPVNQTLSCLHTHPRAHEPPNRAASHNTSLCYMRADNLTRYTVICLCVTHQQPRHWNMQLEYARQQKQLRVQRKLFSAPHSPTYLTSPSHTVSLPWLPYLVHPTPQSVWPRLERSREKLGLGMCSVMVHEGCGTVYTRIVSVAQ